MRINENTYKTSADFRNTETSFQMRRALHRLRMAKVSTIEVYKGDLSLDQQSFLASEGCPIEMPRHYNGGENTKSILVITIRRKFFIFEEEKYGFVKQVVKCIENKMPFTIRYESKNSNDEGEYDWMDSTYTPEGESWNCKEESDRESYEFKASKDRIVEDILCGPNKALFPKDLTVRLW